MYLTPRSCLKLTNKQMKEKTLSSLFGCEIFQLPNIKNYERNIACSFLRMKGLIFRVFFLF